MSRFRDSTSSTQQEPITIGSEKGVVFLSLRGKLTSGSILEKGFRREISRLLDSGQKRFEIDLKECTAVDSSGVGELVAALRAVEKSGGELTLNRSHLPPRLRDILEITRVLSFFD